MKPLHKNCASDASADEPLEHPIRNSFISRYTTMFNYRSHHTRGIISSNFEQGIGVKQASYHFGATILGIVFSFWLEKLNGVRALETYLVSAGLMSIA